ncbi:hypothetical protein EHQ27_09265 [Leptospira wolffii]|uniref:hypothetical protein n=1 Tax=Leptospira wolffii TaxID=409998 RepID=UPI0003456396|nr:hypothetical protein [Leptospira wolffii]TGK58813.1 hypothetical protein EHQ32_12245 [Leptospira wolffii]TGK72624.1 hypothetical protein EHQ27_09265 [Leptospira wolffii]TGK72721.1 hypothetical protein EHQ35_11315 [Leptospira wolffii]TGL26912.1 hypothetical protein EHQ57_17790 [Leptospira wolffii]
MPLFLKRDSDDLFAKVYGMTKVFSKIILWILAFLILTLSSCRSLGANRIFRPGVEMNENITQPQPLDPPADFTNSHVSLRMGNQVKSQTVSFEEDFFRGKETTNRFKALVKELNDSGSFKTVIWEESIPYGGMQSNVIYGDLELAEIRATNHAIKLPFVLLAIVGYFLFPTTVEINSTAILTLRYPDAKKPPLEIRSIVSGTSYEHFGEEQYRKLFNDIKLKHVENLTASLR